MTIDYSKINQPVVNRMDLCTIQQNIDDFVYRSYEAFLSDIKWIVHNVKVHTQLGKKKNTEMNQSFHKICLIV